jgi:hypothetical protein
MRGIAVRIDRVFGIAWLVFVLAAPSAKADSVTRKVIDRVIARPQGACFLVDVRFNLPMQYLSHFPPERSDELEIRLSPITAAARDPKAALGRESALPEPLEGLPLDVVNYEADDPLKPLLSLRFRHPVAYAVKSGADFRSLLIQIRPPTVEGPCPPFEAIEKH